MNEINILSIDFDWIMEPCINVYNNIANSITPLDEVLKDSPNAFFKPDYEKFKTLLIYATNIARDLPDSSRVLFGLNHQEILTGIEKIWKIQDKPYNIYNIDHHHDCGYTVENWHDIINQGPTCGNWINYCKNLNSYTWINNKNSQETICNDAFKRLKKYTMCHDINIINYVNFDYLFICKSPGWIPKELDPLFNILEFNINTNVNPAVQEENNNANTVYSA